MIHLKKIAAFSFILFLLCLSVQSMHARAEASTTLIQAKHFVIANMDKQHTTLFTDFVMESVDDDLSEETLADFSGILYQADLSALQNCNKNTWLYPDFYEIKIKSISSEPSFLMSFRI